MGFNGGLMGFHGIYQIYPSISATPVPPAFSSLQRGCLDDELKETGRHDDRVLMFSQGSLLVEQ